MARRGNDQWGVSGFVVVLGFGCAMQEFYFRGGAAGRWNDIVSVEMGVDWGGLVACGHKLHGLKSGKTLKEFQGHSSYVNDAILTSDGGRVITASSVGSVKVWDVKNTDCLQTFKTPPPLRGGNATVNSVHLMLKNPEHIMVCNRASAVYVMTLQGQILLRFCSFDNGSPSLVQPMDSRSI